MIDSCHTIGRLRMIGCDRLPQLELYMVSMGPKQMFKGLARGLPGLPSLLLQLGISTVNATAGLLFTGSDHPAGHSSLLPYWRLVLSCPAELMHSKDLTLHATMVATHRWHPDIQQAGLSS